MNNADLGAWIRELIKQNRIYAFYHSREWEALRAEVFRDAHYECQRCIERGLYTRATMVHHINEVRKCPELALSKFFVDSQTGETKQNLIALCHACHEKEHDRSSAIVKQARAERFTNAERW